MIKSLLTSVFISAGIILSVYAAGSYFLYSFQYQLTKDGADPDQLLENKKLLFLLGLIFVFTGFLLYASKKTKE